MSTLLSSQVASVLDRILDAAPGDIGADSAVTYLLMGSAIGAHTAGNRELYTELIDIAEKATRNENESIFKQLVDMYAIKLKQSEVSKKPKFHIVVDNTR